MVISYNMAADNTLRQLKINNKNKTESTKKLSSGYKINQAKDDAAGLSISEKMRHQIRGLNKGADNINAGVSFCKVADSALDEMQNMCQRINQLAIQATNGTNSQEDRSSIDDEVQQLKSEISKICVSTKFNQRYIFKIDELDDEIEHIEPYDLSFTDYPTDLQIYNDSYDDVTKTAAYGGIVYNNTRYSWSGIDADMYDSVNNVFREGNYSFTADDGTTLKFRCENGSAPPQVSREYTMSATMAGITINGNLIDWTEVTDSEGLALDKENIKSEPYSFKYNGSTISFTPALEDEFENTIKKLCNTKWKSSYKIPTEQTALYGNFNSINIPVTKDTEIKNYLDSSPVFDFDYIVHAGDGTGGTKDGIWITKRDAASNETEVTGSFVSWADLYKNTLGKNDLINTGITDWGNLSTDISENYSYIYDPDKRNGIDSGIKFSFQLINETSKASIIDALDNVGIKVNDLKANNGTDLSFVSNDRVVGGKITQSTIHLSVSDEYYMGRDFSDADSDMTGAKDLKYDDTAKKFSVNYSNTKDGITITKTYESLDSEISRLTDSIADEIIKNTPNYTDVLTARYKDGASKPLQMNIASLISGNITGSGSTTYFENVVTVKPSMKSTLSVAADTDFAGAYLDFSKLGTDYNLADLIGTGFNTTCETCNNHYSIQFVSSSEMDTSTWNTASSGGNDYKYRMTNTGENYTLNVDVSSMYGMISDGIEFSDALVDIADQSGFDFHYSQYASGGDGKFYVFDNRSQYAANGVSTATKATFEPYSFTFDPSVNVDFTLYDSANNTDYMSLSYRYDYLDIIDDSCITAVQNDASGKYVKISDKYELYDVGNSAHARVPKFDITDVTFPKTKAEVVDYIEKKIYKNIADASDIALKANDFVRVAGTADENPNVALVTEFNTPYQIKDPQTKNEVIEEDKYLRIQCSSNSKDSILMRTNKISNSILGIKNLKVTTSNKADAAIEQIGGALKKLSSIRSDYGAYQNRLEHAYQINQNTKENTENAESKIRDTDMAEEMVAYSKHNILTQAGTSILAQANHFADGVLALLQ